MPKKQQKSRTVQSRHYSDGPLPELAEQVAVGLTPSQGKALLALLAGKKKQDAARIAGVHPNRIGIWLTNDPYFFAAYMEALKWITNDQLHALSQKFRSALDTIEGISRSKGVDPGTRLRAAMYLTDKCLEQSPGVDQEDGNDAHTNVMHQLFHRFDFDVMQEREDALQALHAKFLHSRAGKRMTFLTEEIQRAKEQRRSLEEIDTMQTELHKLLAVEAQILESIPVHLLSAKGQPYTGLGSDLETYRKIMRERSKTDEELRKELADGQAFTEQIRARNPKQVEQQGSAEASAPSTPRATSSRNPN